MQRGGASCLLIFCPRLIKRVYYFQSCLSSSFWFFFYSYNVRSILRAAATLVLRVTLQKSTCTTYGVKWVPHASSPYCSRKYAHFYSSTNLSGPPIVRECMQYACCTSFCIEEPIFRELYAVCIEEPIFRELFAVCMLQKLLHWNRSSGAFDVFLLSCSMMPGTWYCVWA